MIITRTPFRISFFGGGTDYPAWYEEHGGAVLSTSIDKYCYICCRYLPPYFTYNYRIRYSVREETQTLAEIRHPSVRACLQVLGIEQGVEMVHTSDIPAMSGIGSSSSFTVGFLNSLYALKGSMVSKRDLAREAMRVEQDVLRENVGSQDQVAAAFGGFNRIEFGPGRDFDVHPVTIPAEKLRVLSDHLMLFFTGFSRIASDIAGQQIENIPKKARELQEMRGMVDEGVRILNGPVDAITDFGSLLHESWQIKRSLSPLVSTDRIDEIYEQARRAGASGGKVLGAGGGGFVMFFARPERQAAIRAELRDLLHVPFAFDGLGSQVTLYSPEAQYDRTATRGV